ncbi:hypothetical protein FB567DRAFT_590826 [Paraphoma chrysanthemicola]|uniref:Uncharacterized protein n=1 Tax=Paraphoma chrysanthemicola TaxID=798071 RepID=A0A8K0R7E4_9PLEO|nr:hypothetical protein FB567DRAFT_590826 [Paraphoma chrysanthemicola]
MSSISLSSRPSGSINWADDDEDDFDFEAWKATADTSAPTVDSLPPLQLPPPEVEPLLVVCGNEKVNDAAPWAAEPAQQPEVPKLDLDQMDEWCGKRTAAWRAVNDRSSRPAYPTLSAYEGGLLCADQRVNYASNWQKTKVECGLNCKRTAMLMLSTLRMVTFVEPDEVADDEDETEDETTVEEVSDSSRQVSDSDEEDSPRSTPPSLADDECAVIENGVADIGTATPTQHKLLHTDTKTQETLRTPDIVSASEDSSSTATSDLSDNESSVTKDDTADIDTSITTQQDNHGDTETHTKETLYTPDTVSSPETSIVITPTDLSNEELAVTTDDITNIHATPPEQEALLEGLETQTQETLRTPDIRSTPKLHLITALPDLTDEGYHSASSTITSPTLPPPKDTTNGHKDKTSHGSSVSIILAIARKSKHKHSRTDSMDALKKFRHQNKVEKNNDGQLEAIDLTHTAPNSDEKPGVATYLSHAAAMGWGYVASIPWTVTTVVATGVIVGGALHFARRR